MAFLFRLLRSNAHATNYLLIGGAVTIPVLIFADRHQKSPDQIEAVLNESYGDKVARTKEATEKINSFWKGKRTAKEMDEVYSQLLRSGKGAVSRHHELSGALAEAESKQNPKFAHMQAILAVPEGATKDAPTPATEAGPMLASPAAAKTVVPAPKLVVDAAAPPAAPPR